MWKRSSWDSGSTFVPACSTGFCVATTKKGFGSACVVPSTVTEASAIASSSADWVLGLARFDLVGDHDVREERAGLEAEPAGRLAGIELGQRTAHDVRREQVARELDAAEAAVDAAGERGGEGRLAHARHVLDQQVSAGHQRFDGPFDDVELAPERGRDGVAERASGLGGFGEARGLRLGVGHGASDVLRALGRGGNPTSNR